MRWVRPILILLVASATLATWFAIAFRPKEASMDSTPAIYNPLLVRTDFSDEDAWQAIRARVLEIPPDLQQGIEAMRAVNEAAGVDVSGYDQPLEFVNIIDDLKHADRSTDEVLKLAAKHDACIFVVDRQTISDADQPVLVFDLSHQRGRTFRTVPSEVGAIASNLSIANADWEDFADNVGSDGVYRGFPRSAP
jgi:hypothetical protein